jgi:hypothetical protein
MGFSSGWSFDTFCFKVATLWNYQLRTIVDLLSGAEKIQHFFLGDNLVNYSDNGGGRLYQ